MTYMLEKRAKTVLIFIHMIAYINNTKKIYTYTNIYKLIVKPAHQYQSYFYTISSVQSFSRV